MLDQLKVLLGRKHWPSDYAGKLLRQHSQAKTELNQRFGLKESNQYRIIIDVETSEEDLLYSYRALRTLSYWLAQDLEDKKAIDAEFSYLKNRVKYSYNAGSIGVKTVEAKITKLLQAGKAKEHIQDNVYYLADHFNINRYKLSGEEKTVEALFNAIVTKIGELGSTKTAKKLVLSSNLLDIMTASTDAAFSSCHDMDSTGSHGQYNAGVVQYSLDSFTLIAFVAMDGELERKIGRCLVFFNPQNHCQYLIGRIYGDGSLNSAVIRQLNGLIQSYYTELSGLFEGDWNEENVDMSDFEWKPKGIDGSGDAGYGGYMDFSMVFHYLSGFGRPFKLEFPSPLCLQCGQPHEDSNKGEYCHDCGGNGCRCYDCNERLSEDDCFYNDDGNAFCESCFNDRYFVCQRCGETCSNDYQREDNRGRSICESCFDDHFTTCTCCGEVLRQDESIRSNDYEDYCEECYGNHYIQCISCDEEFEKRDSTEIDGDWYCESCANAKFEESEEELMGDITEYLESEGEESE